MKTVNIADYKSTIAIAKDTGQHVGVLAGCWYYGKVRSVSYTGFRLYTGTGYTHKIEVGFDFDEIQSLTIQEPAAETVA